MKTISVYLVLAFLTLNSYAGELLVVTAVAQGTQSDSHTLVERAKRMALAKLPRPNMIQRSQWTSNLALSGGAGRWYGSVGASFIDADDVGPYYLDVWSGTPTAYDRNDAPALIEKEKAYLTRKASFYCNSRLVEPIDWKEEFIADGVPGTPNYKVIVSARIECE